jgi:hypothetical protein
MRFGEVQRRNLTRSAALAFVVLLSVSPWARSGAGRSGEDRVVDGSEGPISFEPNRGQG